MFFTIMQDNRLCTRLLQELFPLLKIQQIYDIEMQMSSKFNHKRVRYYRSGSRKALLKAKSES